MAVTAPATSPVAVGDVLSGKYVVERLVGRGSMGVVVAARHMQLDQLLAVKLMPADAALDGIAVQRFQQEARAAASLRSDHVTRVLDVGELPTGEPFMVMEYLAGDDLGAVLEAEGPLPVGVACDYVVQACEAVGEAHAMGIVHRDLKPENLHLSADLGGHGFVKVLDFGVSKLMTPRQGVLTSTQTVVGSPLYMAPEQLRSSRRVDPRSDVWALGVVLYELLTQRLPFEAQSLPELCLKVVHDEPRPIGELRADLPRGVAAVIARCLQKDPDARYADATELAAALAPFVHLGQAPRTAGSSGRLAVAGVAGVAGSVPKQALAPLPGEGAVARSLLSTVPAETAPSRSVAPRAGWLAAAALAAVLGVWAARDVLLPARHASTTLAFAAVDAARASWAEPWSPPSAPVAPETPAATQTPAVAAPAPRPPRPTRTTPRPARVDDDIPAFR